jgi:hypothetical protein
MKNTFGTSCSFQAHRWWHHQSCYLPTASFNYFRLNSTSNDMKETTT